MKKKKLIQFEAQPKSRLFEIKMFRARKYAELEAQKAGFGMPEPPNEERKTPRFPEDITAVSDRKLGRLFSKFTAWAVYAETQVALTDIDMSIAEEVKDFVESRAILDSERASVTDRKAEIAMEKEVKRVRLHWIRAHAKFTMFKAHLRRFERGIGSISREISRRSAINPYVTGQHSGGA